MKEKIKIALLIKNDEILLWEYKVLEKLYSCEFAEIRLLIKKEDKPLLNNNRKYSGIYRFHEKLDRYFFKNDFDYNEKINLLNLTKEIPLISYDQSEDDLHGSIIKEIPQKIKDYKIDIILNFGVESINSELIKIPKYGILSYRIGDDGIIKIEPPAYWEIVKNTPEITCIVSMLTPDSDCGTIIYQTSVSTFTKSININKNRAYGLASLIVPRLIRGLYLSGDLYLDELTNKFDNQVGIYNSKVNKSPTSFQALWNLILLFTNYLYRKITYQKKDFWYLLYKINKKNNSFPAVINSFNSLKAPKGKFWADPFVVSKNGYYYIFVEEYIYNEGKAHLSVLKLDGKGKFLSSEKIIERPYHISYPSVFEWNNQYYMIPESRSIRTIQLFRCTDFPNKWEFVTNLMEDIYATDSTLFFYNDKWWLFTAVDELNNPSIPFSELFLYFTNDLFTGNWQSHPMNPIITDIKTSRPAGKIFILNDKIYRPSQDCSGNYGKAFNLMQIIELSERRYKEILVSKIEPNWDRDLTGTHTFNFDRNFTVLDVNQLKRRIRVNFL